MSMMRLNERQEAELVTAIQGRGEVPLKFAYLGDGASNWDRVARERSEGEGINSAEAALLGRRIDDFLSTLDLREGVNVIDIGCGNGVPVFPILKELVRQGVSFRYVPMDISSEMLTLAGGSIQREFPGTVQHPIQLDFELGQFSDLMYELKKDGSVNLMLFLGSTLGNHSDLNRVLTNFRDSLTSKDFLILGVELTNLAKVHHLIPHYENKRVRDLVTYTLGYLKIPGRAYSYEVSWDEGHSQIEMRAVLNKQVEVGIAGESFVLKRDEELLLGRSMKFTEYSITRLLSEVGFRTELLTTAEDRGYLLSMVQPTRYSV